MRRVTSDADLAVACPLCHAQPGRPCGWKGAVYAGVVHRERRRALAAALDALPEQAAQAVRETGNG